MQNTIFEDIPSKHKTFTFGKGKFADFEVFIIRENGYINATKICKLEGKKLGHWNENTSSKDLINKLSSYLGIPVSDLSIEIRYNVTNKLTGTYLHPSLIPHVMFWLSPTFMLNIGDILFDRHNIEQTWLMFSQGKVLKKEQAEKRKQLKLAKELNGLMEVKTPVGVIDILTFDEIIEVKEASMWKHALGQVISYGLYYPINKKVIYLFGRVSDFDLVETSCKAYNVEVRLC